MFFFKIKNFISNKLLNFNKYFFFKQSKKTKFKILFKLISRNLKKKFKIKNFNNKNEKII